MWKRETGVLLNFFSPFLSELFTNRIENDLLHKDRLPKIQTRYVDDIFTLFHKHKVGRILAVLNKVKLKAMENFPFLDLRMI